MNYTIEHKTLQIDQIKTRALVFKVDSMHNNPVAVFAHGYTSHKGSILTWAQKCVDLGISCVLLDLPGHLLGHEYPVLSIEEFERVTPQLFISALNLFDSPSKVIFGGHSLGALMSLKASMLTKVDLVCCVGFGLDHPSKPHLFETPLFQETLHLRSQLVSPSIRHELLFPWLKEQKINLNISNQNIYLLAGLNDIVIGGKDGLNRIKESLEPSNGVQLETPKNLAHHEPENAGIFLKKFIQQNVLS